MSIPLSHLMQSDNPDVGPPTATHNLCLSAKLFQELQDATDRYTDLEGRIAVAHENVDDPDRPTGPRPRLGHKTKPDVAKLEAEAEVAAEVADEIRDRMEEVSVDLHLRVNEDAWTEFVRAHPARDATENAAGSRLDRMYTGGLCDVDALIDKALTSFIAKYGDENPTPAMWDYARINSARGDRYMAASKVVQLHTAGIDLGKSRTALRSAHRSSPGSE